MNERLHEKKRVGELEELGFELRSDLRPSLSDDEEEAFVKANRSRPSFRIRSRPGSRRSI